MYRLVVHGRAVLIASLFLALPARAGQLSPFGGSLVTLQGAIDRAAFDDGSEGIEYTVPAGGDLQAAIDGAQPGDTILLTPGATMRVRSTCGRRMATASSRFDRRRPIHRCRATACG